MLSMPMNIRRVLSMNMKIILDFELQNNILFKCDVGNNPLWVRLVVVGWSL
jgi:hypothetical protein